MNGEYRIKVTVRNALLLKAIEDQGYKSVAAFARSCGVNEQELSSLVAMRHSPITKDGEFSKLSKIVMEALGACPTDLWTERQLTIRLKTNTGERDVDGAIVHHLLEERESMAPPTPEQALLSKETSELVSKILDTIPSGMKTVLMEKAKGATTKEIAEMFDMTQERVRQIERRAYEILRYPSRIKIVEELKE